MKDNKFKIVIYVLIIILFSSAIYLIFGNRFEKKSKIVIGVNEWYGFAPIVYAERMGYFKENNIDIEIKLFEGLAQSNKAFENRITNGLLTVLTDVVYLKGIGVPIKIASVIDISLYGDAIIAQPQYKDLRDLKGKTIGLDSLNSFSEYFVTQALLNVGLSAKDVTFKIIPYNKISEALKNNTVQAAHSWDPGKKEALDKGMRVIFYAGQLPNSIIDTLSFNEEIVNEQPETIQKIIELFFKARDEMYKNPLEGAKVTSSFFKNEPKAFAESLKEIHLLNRIESLEFLRKRGNISQLEAYAKNINDFFYNKGIVKSNELYKNLIIASE